MPQTFPFPLAQSAGSNASMSSQNAQVDSLRAMAATSQPAQQMAFQANGQLPVTDMSALLQNVSPQQLAAIGHLFQTGQLQLPPQPPPAAVPSSSNQAGTQAQTSANAATRDSDADKEEGEWEEGEDEVQKERGFLRPPPSGPRKRSRSPGHGQARHDGDMFPRREGPSPKQQKKNRTTSREQGAQPRNDNLNGSSDTAAKQAAQRQAKRDAAKNFVAAAYRAGFSFDDFAREVGDATALRSLFRELELETAPSRAPYGSVPQVNGSMAAVSSTDTSPTNGVSASNVSAPRAAAVPAPSPSTVIPKRSTTAKPAGTVDRQAYLAKLQAAKNKSANLSASNATAVQTTPGVDNAATHTGAPQLAGFEGVTPIDSPETSPAPAPAAAVQPTRKVNVNNDLVRQRLEALRRDQAQKQLAAAAASDSDASAPQPTSEVPVQSSSAVQKSPLPSTQLAQSVAPLTDTVNVPPTAPLIDTQVSSTHTTSSAPFPGLPGLFMTGSPFQAKRSGHVFPGLAAPPPIPQSQPPVPLNGTAGPVSNRASANASGTASASGSVKQGLADRIESQPNTPVPGRLAGQRPFRRSKSSDDDKLIINASDEDESELDDGKDEDTDRSTKQSESYTYGKPSMLGNFPPPPPPPPAIFTMQSVSSMPGTPGAVTPGSKAHQLEYDAKMQAIEVMHRRIAVLQKQRSEKTKAKNVVSPKAETARQDEQGAMLDLRGSTVAPAQPAFATQMPSPSAPVSGGSTQSDSVMADEFQLEPADNSVEEQERKEEIEDMEAQLAQLERETGTTQQELNNNVQEGEPVVNPSALVGEAAVPTASDDTTSASGSDEAMDVSSESEDDSHESRQETGNQPEEGEDDEDEDMYDPAELGNLGHDNHQAPPSQGVTDATTVSPPDSQVASDGDYTNAFLNDESTILMSPGAEAQSRNGVPEHNSGLDNTPSSTSSPSEDEYEPQPAHQDTAVTATDASPHVDNSTQPAALPSLGVQVALGPSVSREGPKNSEEDLAPELQPTAAENLQTFAKPKTESRSFFKPYESPLAIFKDFRYHPEFSQTVSGGFKSLTYSNKLNPNLVLCPRETTEGECHDQGCEYQHFRGMAVNDNELLKELGTRNIPKKTAEDDKRWKEGLTKVVQQLRASNQGKDVNAIAARIAQFRREFVGKPGNVLSLDLP